MAVMSEAARDAWRAATIGYVFQTFNLLQGYTALENVLLGMMFGRGADTAHAAALLDRMGLAHRRDYRPRHLGGQQQRWRWPALANRPTLVLADEPTGNLDPRHAAEALELMRASVRREHGAALLLVSHDPPCWRFDRAEDLPRSTARWMRGLPPSATAVRRRARCASSSRAACASTRSRRRSPPGRWRWRRDS
jgi:ABC-type lipoprotein export system ATPase subunit